jgi:oxygen-independent coproporphyrinogen III oxidase
METLGIYISIPFCRSKCSYCNFASGVFPASSLERYVDRLKDDIRGIRSELAAKGVHVPDLVDSVYLGGGTPSTLPPDFLRSLFETLRAEFQLAGNAEVTLECAPGQMDDGFLAAMVEVGVNRVSFGVQSFVDREAAVTGRLHNREIALRDLRRVREAGISRRSVDLIAGLPHQTAASWRESLEILVSTGIDHASIYMLEVDEDSRLGRELLAGGGRYHAGSVPSDDLVTDFYLEAVEVLGRNGLLQYEISNFAVPGAESLHNEKYWLRQPYLGFGVDAHSMLRTEDGGSLRFETSDSLDAYPGGEVGRQFHWPSRQQEMEEAWFLGLRRSTGVSRTAFQKEFGLSETESYTCLIEELVGDKLLEINGNQVRLTSRGRLLSNEVFGRFLHSGMKEEAGFAVEIT